MLHHTGFILSFLAGLACAGQAPNREAEGLKVIFEDRFPGAAGASPNAEAWTMIDGGRVTNNEYQTYKADNKNMQISGGGTLQIVPNKDASGKWTSGRLETKGSWEAPVGGMLQIEGAIRFGWNPKTSKRGIWPAFWAMGDSIHHGTPWPQCGELDIMEQLNGDPVAYATVHCGVVPGGPCNEMTGIQSTTPISDDGFHTWAVRIDRRNQDWRQQVITWTKDGRVFLTVTGGRINDQAVWSTLAHSPMFILMNVAVGGDWPGNPDDQTMGGYGSMMEVEYIAVYST
ncbi:hypothetical protein RB594_005700 [Gaeumannomyces avenae]